MLLKDHIKKQRYVSPTDNAEPYIVINKNTLTKKDDIYRKKSQK